MYLEIHETAAESFQLLRVTWIGCLGLTPFEIDIELNPTDDQCFSKTVFRIGMLDERGIPRLSDCREKSVAKLLAMRPQRNQDWAMAVELTPR
ncbi:MAG: hypothetical protein SFU86_00860 [Pirellulaceae bacterium]|nr:hypothetical protein [Pirellulaceae bacterium]